jgi:DNA polymerase-3 subunit delta'
MAFSVETAMHYLENAHRLNRLAHGYLITGEEGRSEEKLATAMIRMVNGGDGDSLESHRSEFVHLVQPESKSRRITVEQIHDLEKSLYMGAPKGKTKVAVIREADRLGQEAENAFLKTLEEPPNGSLILLLTSHPQQLLDTILSRCIRIPLMRDRGGEAAATPEQERILSALEAHFRGSGDSVSRALGLAGKFTEILRSVKGEIAKRHEATLKEETKTYEKRIEGDWLEKREAFLTALTETVYIEKRNRLVDTLTAYLGDALRLQHGMGHLDLPGSKALTLDLSRRFDVAELSRRFAALERMRSLMDTNTNEKLVLEVAFMEAFG